MRYHYQKRIRHHDYLGALSKALQVLVPALFVIMLLDLIFNYGTWTIESIIFISELLGV